MKVGRPLEYTKEVGDKIAEQIATGNSLRKVCDMEDMPSIATVFKWMREIPAFLKQYEHSTSERTEYQHEELLQHGDNAIAEAKTVDPKVGNAVVSAYKLKSDNLKWSMSRMKPKKFGDKLDMTSGGSPIQVVIPEAVANAFNLNGTHTEANRSDTK